MAVMFFTKGNGGVIMERTTKTNVMWAEVLKKSFEVVECMTEEELKEALALELLKGNYVVENITGRKFSIYKDY